MNYLYCLVGKSATGKTALMQALRDAYGFTYAESYTDRPRRTPDETGHIFVSPEEFDNMPELMLRRNSADGRYGMTRKMLDTSTVIALDCQGARELLESSTTRPVKVIGIFSPLYDRIERYHSRGQSGVERQVLLDRAEQECDGMEDICDIIIPNKDLKTAVTIIKLFIDFFEESAWTMTDNSCFQFRRRLPDLNGMPYYELAQVNACGGGLFKVAHGWVSLACDVDDGDMEELADQYGWTPSSILGSPGAGTVAEAIFENGWEEYNLPPEYHTFRQAAKALCQLIGLKWEDYRDMVGSRDD